jgi:hypothetical protein
MEFIHDFPVWSIGPVCVLAFVLPTIVGLWLVSSIVHQRLKISELMIDNAVVGWFFSGILTLYGITLGLIAVTTWESSSRVSSIASQEAATIAALYRDLSGYTSPVGAVLQNELRDYTRFLIEKSWPAQRRGEILDEGNRKLDNLQRVLYRLEPTTDGQKILHAETLKAYNEFVKLRRERIEAVNVGVPGVMWAVILLGGALTIMSSFCFQVKELQFHMLLSVGVAVMVGLLVYLIAALDRPYRGAVSVEPTAYKIVLDRMMAPPESK